MPKMLRDDTTAAFLTDFSPKDVACGTMGGQRSFANPASTLLEIGLDKAS